MDLRLESLKGFGGKILQAGLGFAGTIIFARFLGPTAFGGFYFLLTLVLLSDRPLRGLGQAVQKRYSETGAPKEQIVGAVLGVNGVFVVAAGVAVWAARRPLINETGLDAAPLVFMALLACLAVFFPFQQMLGAQGWVGLQTWNDTLRSVLTLALQLVFVFAGFGAAGMGYGLAGASLLVVPVALYFLKVRPRVPSRETLGSLWEYAKYSTPVAFVGKAYDRFDVLLIGAVLTTASVGYYEVALKLTMPAIFLPQVVSSGLMPKISNKHSRGEPVAEDISNAAAYISLFSVPLFFGALALSERLVLTAYGPAYRAAAPLLVGLALYQLLRSQTKVYRHTLAGFDRPDLNLRIDITTLAVNIIIGLALIFTFGVIGVVIATVIAEGLRYLLSAYGVHRLTDAVEYVPEPLRAQFLAAGGMFVGLSGVTQVLRMPTFLHVLLVVGIGAVIYALLLVVISQGVRLTAWGAIRDALGEDRLQTITGFWRT